MSLRLWEQVAAWKSPKYRFVDLTHELSPETPHWWGFKPLKETTLYDYPEIKKTVTLGRKRLCRLRNTLS